MIRQLIYDGVYRLLQLSLLLLLALRFLLLLSSFLARFISLLSLRGLHAGPLVLFPRGIEALENVDEGLTIFVIADFVDG